MEITYYFIISVVTFILGAITKTKIDKIPNKYIPLQNVIIGAISTVLCIVLKIEPNPLQAFALCFAFVMGAGGVADLTNKNNYKNEVK